MDFVGEEEEEGAASGAGVEHDFLIGRQEQVNYPSRAVLTHGQSTGYPCSSTGVPGDFARGIAICRCLCSINSVGQIKLA